MIYILLIIQQLLASLTHVIAKDLIYNVSPWVSLLLRSAVISTAFGLWLILSRKKLKRIERKDYMTLAILAVLNIPVNQLLFFVSVGMTTPQNVALAYALSPAFVLVIAMLFLKEKAGLYKIAGVAVAFAGVVMVLYEKGLNIDSTSFTGNLLALAASIAWAFYTVIGKSFTLKYGAVYSTSLTMIFGFLAYLPVFLLSGYGGSLDVSVLTIEDWLQILYLGLITSGVAYIIWYYALKKTDAGKVALFNNLQPVFTTILAVIVFGYSISGLFIGGGLLIIAGVMVAQKKRAD